MIRDTLCEVVYQESLGGDYFKIGLKTGWKDFQPGQFGMLEVPREGGVLLRRPFSFARQLGQVTEIVYKVVGRGTRVLRMVGKGQSLRLLGPLGCGFKIPQGAGDLVGVAGGYGIAPFLQMASQLKGQGRSLVLFYGARSKVDLLYIQELKVLNIKLYISTEDGSEGEKGLVTEALARIYGSSTPCVVFSCGPMGLLKAVKKWAASQKVACQLSVEETMGCGTGICLGCVVQDSHGEYIRACIEGPVFEGEGVNL